MRDDQSRSEWLHFTGECILGPMAGRSLGILDTSLMSWQAFKELHAGHTVIEHTQAAWRRAMGALFGRREMPLFRLPGMFTKTMRERDGRLPDMEFGLGIAMGRRSLISGTQPEAARFYPLKAVRTAGIINDRLGNTPVVILMDEKLGSPSAFFGQLGENEVRLERDVPGLFRDEVSGAVINCAGKVIRGPLQNQKLKPAMAIATRWYGFSQTYPSASIWSPSGAGR